MRARLSLIRSFLITLIPVSAVAGFLLFGFMFPRQAQKLPTDKDRIVTVFDSQMRYREQSGPGVTLIFLHGFGGSLKEWDKVIASLPNHRAIALDLIGFGGSDRSTVDYDLECHRHYVIGFMDALGINQAVIVGQSMGASVAAWTAAHSQDRIAAVVMLAPSGVPNSLQYRWPLGILYRPGLGNIFASRVVDSGLFRWLFPTSLARQGLAVTNNYNDRFTEALTRIDQPALLIWSACL